MDLKNGYKVLYEVVGENDRVFKASKTGNPEITDTISTIAKGTYKIIYEKEGKLFGGTSNIPTTSDVHLRDFDDIFIEKVPVVTFTVTFTDGEDVIERQSIVSGQKAQQPSDPEKDDLTFNGWYVDDVAYDFNAPVTSDLTIVAKWNEDNSEEV